MVLQLVYPTKLVTTAITLAVSESVSKVEEFLGGLSPLLVLISNDTLDVPFAFTPLHYI